MTMPEGSVIAGYTIERTLGAGGMGTVYLARHPTLPRSDALKVLSAELSADPQFRARFRREADLAASLDHPNIVRVYTRGETEDGRLWIAMQFVDGTDAGKALEAGPLPVERTAHIITEVAKALDYAHSRGLLHRDIKPANFLLAGPPGPHERVLLADFGIARAVDDASKLTATGSMMTTVAYASPESVEGKSLDHRSDLYSLGCALYRMLTNRTPYQGVGAMSAVLMAHIMRPPPRPTEFVPGLPPAIDTVIATAMAKDPAARYQTARALAEAASAALAGEQVPEPQAPPPNYPPPHYPQPTYPQPAHQPWMTENTQTYPSGAFTAPAPQFGAPPPGPKGRRKWWLAGTAAALVATIVAAVLLIPGGEPDLGPYPAQTFAHTYGSTRVDQRPTSVATLTLGDADIALSLGLQPVALTAPGGQLPDWLSAQVEGSPAILATADAEAVKAAAPALIIDTDAALTEQGYEKLAEVGPTITRPANGQAFDSMDRLSWIGDILGRQTKARELRDEIAKNRANIVAEHGQFKDTSISVFLFNDSGLSAALSDSPAASYLEGIGFSYNTKLDSGADGQTETPLQADTLSRYESDVALVLRSDKAAGNGGFSGLPSQFNYFGGTVVVVDDPDILTAVKSGGPTATRYLDANLVEILAQQLQ